MIRGAVLPNCLTMNKEIKRTEKIGQNWTQGKALCPHTNIEAAPEQMASLMIPVAWIRQVTPLPRIGYNMDTGGIRHRDFYLEYRIKK